MRKRYDIQHIKLKTQTLTELFAYKYVYVCFTQLLLMPLIEISHRKYFPVDALKLSFGYLPRCEICDAWLFIRNVNEADCA